ncbi:TetR/AcrR family transcriptional regulator [Nocardia arthritidis]|uniref:TetR family transcriptional regulator n=1 Tax=Nocardia arthritidis TaxID=228602 RepID=A0A6G9YJQ5_9NOCA|nr:TetR/AcrR family transcriptional regulator [Nocardia arthritidis]QIS13418.1 TetR family transcriptional regulator [Nocardia arthritidis]
MVKHASRQTNTRERLLAAGLRLLEDAGPEALQARRVAAEIGASTMAVYTHFGGMTGLLESVAEEAFSRFSAAMAAVPRSDDPMADLFRVGRAYREYALANPQRYRLMFGPTAPGTPYRPGVDLTTARTPNPLRDPAFGQLLELIERMIAAGRIRADPALDVAGRLWSLTHGVVTLEITGYFGTGGNTFGQILGPAFVDLFVGMGDERARVESSLRSALA